MSNALVPIECRINAERSVTVHMMRKSYVEVKKNLSPEMEDALMEIEVGFNCIAGELGYPDGDIGRVNGGIFSGFQEWSSNMSQRVREWRNENPETETGAVIDWVVFGKTFKEIGLINNVSRQTASGFFYEGLNKYIKMLDT